MSAQSVSVKRAKYWDGNKRSSKPQRAARITNERKGCFMSDESRKSSPENWIVEQSVTILEWFMLARHVTPCPDCGVFLTSLYLCPSCGKRYELIELSADTSKP